VTLRVLQPPAGELVETTAANAHLNLDGSEDDALVAGLVKSAVGHLDGPNGVLGRALLTQRWALSLPAFPAERVLPLPLWPLQSVEAAKYFDADGAEQLLPPEAYRVLPGDDGGLELVPGQRWPSTWCSSRAVTVEFTAGYGSASDVPAQLRHAVLLLVGHWYIDREGQGRPAAVDLLIGPFKLAEV
jgi:uncharacterized phiE125 gp8 family phage protein